MRVEAIVRAALRSHPALVLVVICGHNATLCRRLKEMDEPRCTVEGFIPP